MGGLGGEFNEGQMRKLGLSRNEARATICTVRESLPIVMNSIIQVLYFGILD